jgi:hypothetical protein
MRKMILTGIFALSLIPGFALGDDVGTSPNNDNPSAQPQQDQGAIRPERGFGGGRGGGFRGGRGGFRGGYRGRGWGWGWRAWPWLWWGANNNYCYYHPGYCYYNSSAVPTEPQPDSTLGVACTSNDDSGQEFWGAGAAQDEAAQTALSFCASNSTSPESCVVTNCR